MRKNWWKYNHLNDHGNIANIHNTYDGPSIELMKRKKKQKKGFFLYFGQCSIKYYNWPPSDTRKKKMEERESGSHVLMGMKVLKVFIQCHWSHRIVNRRRNKTDKFWKFKARPSLFMYQYFEIEICKFIQCWAECAVLCNRAYQKESMINLKDESKKIILYQNKEVEEEKKTQEKEEKVEVKYKHVLQCKKRTERKNYGCK